MKVLVVGGGGREHALCWAIAASPLLDKLYCAPGNAGIAQVADCVAIPADDLDALVGFAVAESLDLVVVGPEAPLVAGLVDRLEAKGIRAFGPRSEAAVLEGSKGFMKDLCRRHGIPTADYARFSDLEAALAYLHERGAPIVVKADGLAAGKGVTVAATLEEAEAAVRAALDEGAFGQAGAEVVIEELLEGEEASVFALVDGVTALALPACQDHKRAYDGDRGPNTGGMGAYSPTPLVDDALLERVMAEIVRPTVAAMKREGRQYRGVLYAGVMVGPDGAPKLLEYNVRFGDPECQVLTMRLMSDLLPALVATCDGVLESVSLRWYEEAALTVVMAARGYPGAYEKGSAIRGLDALALDEPASEDLEVFHAGTTRDADGTLRAAGGRVLNVTALGKTLAEAQARAYAAVDRIDWPEGFCRRDIGWRALQR